MAFTGFSREGMTFFKQLAVRQDREWFKAHKAEYGVLWEAPMKALIEEIAPKIAKQYPKWKLQAPKHFRIYRDVRFAKDKSPFKTNIAAMIGFPGGEEEGAPAALYMHLGLEEVFAAGHWTLPADKLKRYRALVDAEKTGRELATRVTALEKKGFEVSTFESLKRVPPGFDPEHARARLLKQKGLGVTFPKPPAGVRGSAKLASWIVDQSKQAASVVGWLEERLA